MEPIEQAVVRACLRQVSGGIGHTHQSLADLLVGMGDGINKVEARQFLDNQNLSRDKVDILSAFGLRFLVDHRDYVLEYYRTHNDTISLEYVSRLLRRFPTDEIISEVAANLRMIVHNWSQPVGRNVLQTGLYQIVRRYKPLRHSLDMYKDVEDHPIICELIYIDAGKMECMLVTAGHNVYWGSLYMNFQDIVYVIAQRPSETHERGVHQRIYSFKAGRQPRFFAGLCMKTGDHTRRPLCAECIFIFVNPRQHPDVNELFKELRKSKWGPQKIDDQTILDYVTDFPPEYTDTEDESVNRIMHIRDFKEFNRLAKPDHEGVTLFKEPLRAIEADTLRTHIPASGLQVFRHSQLASGSDQSQSADT